MSEAPVKDRLDKWLWHARFFKTRSLAASKVAAGDVRVNGERVTKRATSVTAGDVLTFAQGPDIRVIQIKAMATRRGPATEAQTLYTDMSSTVDTDRIPNAQVNPAYDGKGRPTKRERRQADLSKKRHLE